MEHALKILGKASSINVRKVLWTCEELGVSYEREDWGSGYASTHSPEFLRLNPNAQVPVIIDEAGVLWESNTICRYLAGKHHNTDLLPTNRRRALAWSSGWIGKPPNSMRPGAMRSWRWSARIRSSRTRIRLPSAFAAGTQKMGILEHQLATTKAYVAGPHFTLADIVIGLSVNRWLMTPMERPDYPAIDEYFQRLALRPGFMKHACNGVP